MLYWKNIVKMEQEDKVSKFSNGFKSIYIAHEGFISYIWDVTS